MSGRVGEQFYLVCVARAPSDERTLTQFGLRVEGQHFIDAAMESGPCRVDEGRRLLMTTKPPLAESTIPVKPSASSRSEHLFGVDEVFRGIRVKLTARISGHEPWPVTETVGRDRGKGRPRPMFGGGRGNVDRRRLVNR